MPRLQMLITVHRRPWIREDLVALLAESFDVRVAEVATPLARQHGARVMSKQGLMLTECAFLLRLLLATPALASSDWSFACFGGHLATLAYCRVLRLLGRRPQVYLLNFYFHAMGERAWVKRLLGLLMTRDVRVVAQTTGDVAYFRQFLPANHVTRVPYTRIQDEFVDARTAAAGEYVFSGGWTNRDYDALFRCARRLPDVPFVVVASEHSSIGERMPANVDLRLDLEPAEFDRLVAASRVVVVPLKEDVGSSGQMVLLAGMEFGKPVIASDVGAVRDYVADGATGVLYPLGDEDALARVIGALYGDPDRAARLGRAGRERFLHDFTPENFSRPVAEYIAAG